MGHRPRKRFGQNFLQDRSVIDAILRAFHPKPTDNVIEIGPGLGALTQPLLRHLNHLTAIEIDIDLQALLSVMPGAEKMKLIDADALTVNYKELGERLRIIGNLPYNISTPLLIYLLQQSDSIEDMYFMLQKEVVERLASSPGSKTYGRLSVMAQYYCEVEHLFNVPAEAFQPQPKVESAIVCLTPHLVSPYPLVKFAELERLVASAFSMRRKTLANNLKTVLNATEIAALEIDPSMRPEQISVNDYVKIAKFLNK